MKRTKENWLEQQPADRQGISGLRIFDGEDLHYQERTQAFKETQRKWIEEQKQDMEDRRTKERNEDQAYAFQTLQNTRMRGMLEDKLEQQKRDMQASTRDSNLQLAREKREREQRERQIKLQQERRDLDTQASIRVVPPYQNPLA